jgi:thymidylate synthase (FAD)
MEFIEPDDFDSWSERSKDIFAGTCVDAMENYHQLISNQELKPQQARAVLPNALKTEIIVTADIAEWMHIRKLRTAKDAHPDMQRVMNMMPWLEF